MTKHRFVHLPEQAIHWFESAGSGFFWFNPDVRLSEAMLTRMGYIREPEAASADQGAAALQWGRPDKYTGQFTGTQSAYNRPCRRKRSPSNG